LEAFAARLRCKPLFLRAFSAERLFLNTIPRPRRLSLEAIIYQRFAPFEIVGQQPV
jgi:hypothetical protein